MLESLPTYVFLLTMRAVVVSRLRANSSGLQRQPGGMISAYLGVLHGWVSKRSGTLRRKVSKHHVLGHVKPAEHFMGYVWVNFVVFVLPDFLQKQPCVPTPQAPVTAGWARGSSPQGAVALCRVHGQLAQPLGASGEPPSILTLTYMPHTLHTHKNGHFLTYFGALVGGISRIYLSCNMHWSKG